MFRALLLAFASLVAVGGAMDARAAEADPGAAHATWPADGEVPADPAPADPAVGDGDAEATLGGARLDGSWPPSTPVVGDGPEIRSRRSDPPVPPPR